MLPITDPENLKKKKWSILYSYNIKTTRDIFVYCNLKKKVLSEELYRVMREGRIAPPKDEWVNSNSKRPERLRLEYIHAACYLGLIKKEGDFFKPDFSEFRINKEIIIEANKYRNFRKPAESPRFFEEEKKAMLEIVVNYERAKDFLFWFMDFAKYRSIESFDIEDFRKFGLPIFVLGKIEKGKKGSKVLKRQFEKNRWAIPDSYVRLASYVFPNWFKDLGLIDEIIVFPEFGENRKLWHMFYPIKIKEEDFACHDFEKIIKSVFKREQKNKISIPKVLFLIAQEYYCPVSAIKQALNNLYSNSAEEFYFERVPMHLMKQAYKDSYVEIDGFFRSYLSYEGE